MSEYSPKFLGWCKSLEEEIKEIKTLINGNPADVELLKSEYEILTGEKYEQ